MTKPPHGRVIAPRSMSSDARMGANRHSFAPRPTCLNEYHHHSVGPPSRSQDHSCVRGYLLTLAGLGLLWDQPNCRNRVRRGESQAPGRRFGNKRCIGRPSGAGGLPLTLGSVRIRCWIGREPGKEEQQLSVFVVPDCVTAAPSIFSRRIIRFGIYKTRSGDFRIRLPAPYPPSSAPSCLAGAFPETQVRDDSNRGNESPTGAIIAGGKARCDQQRRWRRYSGISFANRPPSEFCFRNPFRLLVRPAITTPSFVYAERSSTGADPTEPTGPRHTSALDLFQRLSPVLPITAGHDLVRLKLPRQHSSDVQQ